jgi:hypothetical protein
MPLNSTSTRAASGALRKLSQDALRLAHLTYGAGYLAPAPAVEVGRNSVTSRLAP